MQTAMRILVLRSRRKMGLPSPRAGGRAPGSAHWRASSTAAAMTFQPSVAGSLRCCVASRRTGEPLPHAPPSPICWTRNRRPGTWGARASGEVRVPAPGVYNVRVDFADDVTGVLQRGRVLPVRGAPVVPPHGRKRGGGERSTSGGGRASLHSQSRRPSRVSCGSGSLGGSPAAGCPGGSGDGHAPELRDPSDHCGVELTGVIINAAARLGVASPKQGKRKPPAQPRQRGAQR